MPKIEDGCYGSLKGIALIAKVLAGRCRMHYTRVAAGKGAMPEDLTPKTLTEPPEYVMDAMISSVTNPVDGECQVSVQINSVHVENGFYCTWLILYAEDPDEGEVPFTALCLENEPEWIRPASSIVGKLAHFDIIAAVGDVDNVSATIDPDALVTLESVQQLITEHGRDAETHQDIRQAVKALQDKLGGGVVRAERIELTIPAEGWEPDDETGGVYAYRRDIAHAKVEEDMVPMLSVLPSSIGVANGCALCTTASTLSGALRVYAESIPVEEISVSVILLGDVHSREEITIPTVGWEAGNDTDGLFPIHIDIVSEAITATLTPMLTILPESLQAAGDCGLCPATQTMDGTLRLYAKEAPATPLRARLTLLDASQYSGPSPAPGPSYSLPAADGTTLGGVMVKPGSGLQIDGRGNISLDTAGSAEVSELFNGSKADKGQE